MQTFQAICAKNNQRVELVVQYNTLDEERADLHNQGYSIIEIRETTTSSTIGKVFYFELSIDGKRKNGQIQSPDILKAYVKLTDDLHYTVVSIYESSDASEQEKLLITSRVRAGYDIYRNQKSTKALKKENTEASAPDSTRSDDITNSYVGKELQGYYLLIDKVLVKIETLLDLYGATLVEDRRIKLQNLHQSIKQLKNTTNIDKLRLVANAALIKIGEVELELIRGTTDTKKQEFLKETNELLRKF